MQIFSKILVSLLFFPTLSFADKGETDAEDGAVAEYGDCAGSRETRAEDDCRTKGYEFEVGSRETRAEDGIGVTNEYNEEDSWDQYFNSFF